MTGKGIAEAMTDVDLDGIITPLTDLLNRKNEEIDKLRSENYKKEKYIQSYRETISDLNKK